MLVTAYAQHSVLDMMPLNYICDTRNPLATNLNHLMVMIKI